MPKDKHCALYLRSSKDRHDVSIAAQRHELTAIAKSKSLAVAAEFSDAVERADDWQRPGFVDLLRALSDPARPWANLIVLDSARIARDDEYLGAYFRNECRKRGVRILYGKLPSINPMSDLIMQTIDQLISRIHSMTSREKGLAGMAENVRRGFRAGGRAPYGYDLERVPTGAVRDGTPVTKSRLVPNAKAPAIARFLKGRAQGMAAAPLARELGLELSKTSLVGIEWNALTYAGNTVWNIAKKKGDGGPKRRPRKEWHIKAGTHEAHITTEEAEQLLKRLEEGAKMRTRGADYLLSGLLVTPGGQRWHGDAGFYRAGSRSVKAETLERAVLEKLADDLTDDRFVRGCLEAARKAARPLQREAELRTLQRQAAELERKLARVRNLLPEMKHPEALLPKLEELQQEKAQVDRQAAALADQVAADKVLTLITEAHVHEVLGAIAAGLRELDRDQVKQRLRLLIERLELDPKRLTCRISYAIPLIGRDKGASPRGDALNPTPPAALLRARRDLYLVGGTRQRLRRAA
jgi:site-specific DNA recombinase